MERKLEENIILVIICLIIIFYCFIFLFYNESLNNICKDLGYDKAINITDNSISCTSGICNIYSFSCVKESNNTSVYIDHYDLRQKRYFKVSNLTEEDNYDK